MPSVLVTGAARGIGRAIVDHLANSGWDVIAGVRTESDATTLTTAHPQRVSAVILDVTDAGHIAKLTKSLPERLDAVVNNAGIAVGGLVESVTLEDWREQLEINVVGPVAVTQAVLPHLRKSQGRIVFISSINGRISMPLLGPYCASKFALEAAADALRLEVKPWGISVVLVEPAQTDTDMWRTADDLVRGIEDKMSADQRVLYADHIAGMKKFVSASKKLAVPTDRVVAVVDEALTTRRPRARYIVGTGPKLQVALVTNMPTPLRDRALSLMAGLPRRRRG
jgi:NAD(P)-dependent dehydrogenase (short-subunit alcohol dehydrogenase family)